MSNFYDFDATQSMTQPQGSLQCGEDSEEALERIMDGMAESVLQASDEELLEELYDEGVDPIEKANEVRHVLLDAIHRYEDCGRDPEGPVSDATKHDERGQEVLKPLAP